MRQAVKFGLVGAAVVAGFLLMFWLMVVAGVGA